MLSLVAAGLARCQPRLLEAAAPALFQAARCLAQTTGQAVAASSSQSSSQGYAAAGRGSITGLTKEQRSVVPPALAAELEKLDAHFRKSSSIDGRKRLQLATDQLGVKVPKHDIEPGLLVLKAVPKVGTGKTPTKWLRRDGRMPGRIFSLPGDTSIQVHLAQKDGDKIVSLWGRNGCKARVLQLDIVSPDGQKMLASVRVKPHSVMVNSVSNKLENIEFLYTPKHRIVNVDVPIKLVNDDVAPGVRKGGWMAMMKRAVRYQCLGAHIPAAIELDVKNMDLDQEVKVQDLPVPYGTRLEMPEEELAWTVVKCTTDVGKE